MSQAMNICVPVQCAPAGKKDMPKLLFQASGLR